MKQLVVAVPARLSTSLAAELMDLGMEAIDTATDDERPDQVWVRAYCSESAAATMQEQAQRLLDRLAQRFGVGPTAQFEVHEVRSDWETHWALQLEPAHLAGDLVLVTQGVTYHAKPGERVLRLEPGLFFGFGEHPTTQLISSWITEHCAGRTVLDVGCGTGVLSFVAAHAGAQSVLGIDIDALAVESARRNALSNGLDATCKFTDQPLANIHGEYDVVLANIDAGTLCAIGRDLLRVSTAGGRLALTGILDEQAAAVRDCFAEWRMSLGVRSEQQGWVLLCSDGSATR